MQHNSEFFIRFYLPYLMFIILKEKKKKKKQFSYHGCVSTPSERWETCNVKNHAQFFKRNIDLVYAMRKLF